MTEPILAPGDGALTYRHTLPVRIMHWVNAVCLFILLLSGLQIFNAHPALYWGKESYSAPPILEITQKRSADGKPTGVTRVFGREFDTSGVLGLSKNESGRLEPRAFPAWATIPDARWLAMGRRWHLFFAWLFVINGVSFVLYSLLSRHLARDLSPTRQELRGIGNSIIDHVRFRYPTGAAARRYNVLQKLAYLIVIFGLGPLIVLMGLALSPWLNSLFTGWVDLFGGRQSARTLHFLAALALLAFFLIHVFQVAVTGFWNNLRSMLTGRYRIESEEAPDDK
jgi:thiosulfate reductase cytochrome b subunit